MLREIEEGEGSSLDQHDHVNERHVQQPVDVGKRYGGKGERPRGIAEDHGQLAIPAIDQCSGGKCDQEKRDALQRPRHPACRDECVMESTSSGKAICEAKVPALEIA